MRPLAGLTLVLFCVGPTYGLDLFSGLTPQHAVMADFNRDGLDDLAVANVFDDTVAIHLRDSQGMFPLASSISVGINPSSPANFPRFLLVEDLNRDRYPDLIVLCSGQFSLGAKPSVQALLNDRTGGFGRMPASPSTSSFTGEEFPIQFALGEFTGDRYPDLILCNLDGKNLRILEGAGTGQFEIGQEIALDISGEGPQDVAIFDQDRDGLEDLWVVTANAFVAIRQTAPGVFSAPVPFSLSVSPTQLRAVTLDDVDRDGEIDVALADAEGRVHLLKGIDLSGTSSERTLLTDPSLSGCSDIASLLWDGDPLPDLAVANRTGDSVSVFLSSGGVQTMPTGKSPRRIEGTGDYDGDGRVDLVVANEGDASNSGNPDVTLLSNPNPPVARVHIQLESEDSLMGHFDLNIPSAQALAIPEEEDRFWLLDSTRRVLSEADSNGDERRNVEFPFEVGGIHFTDEEEGYVLERASSRLHRFEIDEEEGETDLELELVSNFSFSGGEIGFSGLAFDEDQKEFFVSVPGIGKILRLDEEGDIVSEIDVDIPAWDLAWDVDEARLLASNPGRSEVRAYTRGGTLDTALTEDFADHFGLFDSVGIAGISWSEKEDRTYYLTTSGTLFDGSSGMVDSPLSTSPASEVLAMDYSVSRGELYLLNRGGFFFRLEGEGFQDVDLFSAWPALLASPNFVPAGIAFDETSDEILIVDRDSPVAARFSRSGNFLGVRDFTSEVGAIGGSIVGIDLDPLTDSTVCLKNRFALTCGPPQTETLIDPMARGDFSWGEPGLVLAGRNPGEIDYLDARDGSNHQRVPIEGGRGGEGIAFDSPSTFLVLTQGFETVLRRYRLEFQSGVDRWMLYQ